MSCPCDLLATDAVAGSICFANDPVLKVCFQVFLLFSCKSLLQKFNMIEKVWYLGCVGDVQVSSKISLTLL